MHLGDDDPQDNGRAARGRQRAERFGEQWRVRGSLAQHKTVSAQWRIVFLFVRAL